MLIKLPGANNWNINYGIKIRCYFKILAMQLKVTKPSLKLQMANIDRGNLKQILENYR